MPTTGTVARVGFRLFLLVFLVCVLPHSWTVAVTAEQSSVSSSTPWEVYHLENLEQLQAYISTSDKDTDRDVAPLWVVLFYSDDCAESFQLLQAIRDLVERNIESESRLLQYELYFASLQVGVSSQDRQIFDQLGLSSIPALFIFKQDFTGEQLWAVEYNGHWGDPPGSLELQDGLRHYATRLMHSRLVQRGLQHVSPSSNDTWMYMDTMTIYQQNVETLNVLLNENDVFSAFITPPALDPLLSTTEQDIIQFLMGYDTPRTSTNWIFCRCEATSAEIAQQFDPHASVMASRLDVLFCILEDCPTSPVADDFVHVYEFDKHSETGLQLAVQWRVNEFQEAISKVLRPTVLWWDRQSTMPIAMAPCYNAHATLVFNFHDVMRAYIVNKEVPTRIRSMIHEFENACQQFHTSVVCLVVPSTETRVLKTLGIDLWSTLDPLATALGDENPSELRTELPVLVYTNRSETNGIESFYHHPDPSSSDSTFGFLQFFQDVWDRRLGPELKSYIGATWRQTNPTKDSENVFSDRFCQGKKQLPALPSNSHNVHEWSAYHHYLFQGLVHETLGKAMEGTCFGYSAHTLLMTYAPTCGHCKRLSVLWNQLGRLVRHLHWDSWLQIARLDVTTEAFAGVAGASLLPSVYYYYYPQDPRIGGGGRPMRVPVGPVWYNETEAGSLNDPLRFLEWLVDVGYGLDANELLLDLIGMETAGGTANIVN